MAAVIVASVIPNVCVAVAAVAALIPEPCKDWVRPASLVAVITRLTRLVTCIVPTAVKIAVALAARIRHPVPVAVLIRQIVRTAVAVRIHLQSEHSFSEE